MTSKQRPNYYVVNNGIYTYLNGQNGDFISLRNDKVTTIHQFKKSSYNNKDTFCVHLGHEGGSFKTCSENKKMMKEFVKVLPQSDGIKRSNKW